MKTPFKIKFLATTGSDEFLSENGNRRFLPILEILNNPPMDKVYFSIYDKSNEGFILRHKPSIHRVILVKNPLDSTYFFPRDLAEQWLKESGLSKSRFEVREFVAVTPEAQS